MNCKRCGRKREWLNLRYKPCNNLQGVEENYENLTA
jgi:hypothetical protein